MIDRAAVGAVEDYAKSVLCDDVDGAADDMGVTVTLLDVRVPDATVPRRYVVSWKTRYRAYTDTFTWETHDLERAQEVERCVRRAGREDVNLTDREVRRRGASLFHKREGE